MSVEKEHRCVRFSKPETFPTDQEIKERLLKIEEKGTLGVDTIDAYDYLALSSARLLKLMEPEHFMAHFVMFASHLFLDMLSEKQIVMANIALCNRTGVFKALEKLGN